MGIIKVTPSAIMEGAQQILRTRNALTTEHDAMRAFLANLKGDWISGSSTNYQQVQKDWDDACDGIHTVLLELFRALEIAAENSASTEAALVRMWGNG